MEFLGDLLGIGATAATGGLFGLLGSIIGAGAKYLQRRQEIAAEREERAHELKLMDMQIRVGRSETENELKIVEAQTDANVRQASYGIRETLGSSVHKWVNDVRSLFRPFLTIALWALTAAVLIFIVRAMGDKGPLAGYITPPDAVQLVKYTVYSIVFSASTATVWWFGDRALTPPNMMRR